MEEKVLTKAGTYYDFSGRIKFGETNGVVENARMVYLEYDRVSISGGTWLYGIFAKGKITDCVWKNGTFKSGEFSGHGTWENGLVILGYFNNITWENGEFKEGTMINSTWKNGIFSFGNMDNVTWENGTFENGCIEHSKWLNGVFENGHMADCVWENGVMKGGHFLGGIWKDGDSDGAKRWMPRNFTIKPSKKTINEDVTKDEKVANKAGEYTHFTGKIDWKDTQGYVTDADFLLQDMTTEQIKFYAGTWNDGNFIGYWWNGIWKNGTFKGYWAHGSWHDGTWKDGIHSTGTWYNGVWERGCWENGTWWNGTWKNGYYEKGKGLPKNALNRWDAIKSGKLYTLNEDN